MSLDALDSWYPGTACSGEAGQEKTPYVFNPEVPSRDSFCSLLVKTVYVEKPMAEAWLLRPILVSSFLTIRERERGERAGKKGERKGELIHSRYLAPS